MSFRFYYRLNRKFGPWTSASKTFRCLKEYASLRHTSVTSTSHFATRATPFQPRKCATWSMRHRVLIRRTSSDCIYQTLCHFIQHSFFGEVTHLRSHVFSSAKKEWPLWWHIGEVTCRSDASMAKWYFPRLPVWKIKHNPQAKNVCIHIQVLVFRSEYLLLLERGSNNCRLFAIALELQEARGPLLWGLKFRQCFAFV